MHEMRGKSRHYYTALWSCSEVHKSMSGSATFRRFHNRGCVKRVLKKVGRVLRDTYLLNHAMKSCSRFSIAGRTFQHDLSLAIFTRTAGESGLQRCLRCDESASRSCIACAAFSVADTLRVGGVELHGLCQPACSSALNGDGRLLYSSQACQCKTIADRGIASFF